MSCLPWRFDLIFEFLEILPIAQEKKIFTVLSTSLGKTFFAWRFVLNEDMFLLTISYWKPFVFSDSVFPSQTFTVKLNLRPKNGLTCANSLVKWFFLSEKIFFYFSLLNLNYWCFTTILWKLQKKLKKRNLLKICLHGTYTTDFCNLHSFFLWGKVKIFDFLKSSDKNNTFWA